MAQDVSQKTAYDTLQEYCEKKIPLELAEYGYKFSAGIMINFTPYEFEFLQQGSKYPQRIHRLDLKYFCTESDSAFVKKFIFVDKNIQKQKLRPTYDRSGRYKFPEGMLNSGNELMMALHEGEIIRGVVVWATPYDILLQAGKLQLWVFRHAVKDCALTRRMVTK